MEGGRRERGGKEEEEGKRNEGGKEDRKAYVTRHSPFKATWKKAVHSFGLLVNSNQKGLINVPRWALDVQRNVNLSTLKCIVSKFYDSSR